MSTETKQSHTPGPWHIGNPYRMGDRAGMAPIVGGNAAVALVDIGDRYLPYEANARLIAAAPDMLEALREAADDINMTLRRLEIERQERRDAGERVSIMGAHLDDMWKRLETYRAAITKAEKG